MEEEEIREGDIVEIDYIAEFTKEHISEGKALVIWKGNNHQPLVRKLNTRKTIWTCYEHIAMVVGHIDIEEYMDKALNTAEVEPKTGHWVEENINEWSRKVFCSECGCPPPFEHISNGDVYSANGYGVINKTKYCPNCGADMRGEGDD